MLDIGGRIVSANRALREFLGIDIRSPGRHWLREWVGPQDRAKLADAMGQVALKPSVKLALRMRSAAGDLA